MSNYNSIDDIISSGITNSETLIDNVSYDDNAYTAQGVDWFNFNSIITSSIYISGNTWFGFGSNSEHLKVNRRDTKMWYLYREVGTLYNYYNFLKFRWSGYSQYNNTTESYKLTYDVILFSTGDIFLHMVDIPSSNYDGTFQLVTNNQTYTYTAPTIDTPNVSFIRQPNDIYIISYDIPNILPPYDRKYLVYDTTTNKYYNIVDNALNELTITEVTSENLKTYGFDEPPTYNILKTLTKPKIYYWQDSEDVLPALKVTVSATPPQQTIITDDIDISDKTITGIEKITAEYTGDPHVACSFDNGTTWKLYNGVSWVVLSENETGMTMETLLAITTENWTQILQGLTSFKMRFTLSNKEDTVTNIIINFTN